MRVFLLLAIMLGSASVASADATWTFTTTPSGGAYAPQNIVVAWIERADGTFVRTIYRRANARKEYLRAWVAKAGANDVDAVSGGSINTHITHTVKWNLRDRTGQVLPDGDYVMRLESAEGNSGSAAQNNQGTMAFTKSDTSITMNNVSNGGFINGTFVFNNSTGGCENGILEAGETCDNNCASTCTPTTLTCFSNNLTGSPQLCNVVCATQPITECFNDDGCCPNGCTGDVDNDCPGGGGGGDDVEEISNCSTGGHPGWLLIGLVALGLVVFRRRR